MSAGQPAKGRGAEGRVSRSREPAGLRRVRKPPSGPLPGTASGSGNCASTRASTSTWRRRATRWTSPTGGGWWPDSVPVREPGSPLERLIAAGIIEFQAEEPGGVGDIEPYPASAASKATAPADSKATAPSRREGRR